VSRIIYASTEQVSEGSRGAGTPDRSTPNRELKSRWSVQAVTFTFETVLSSFTFEKLEEWNATGSLLHRKISQFMFDLV